MPTLSRDGVELYYEIHGDGPPVLLVAGLASDSQSWQTVLGALSSRLRVVVVDNRGVGRTRPSDAPTGVELMADDCAALVADLDFGAVTVVGHSMGGFIAQSCAARHPATVDKLVLAATSSVSSRRNDALLSDLATSLERGDDPTTWFRNLFYWIFSARFFDDPKVVDEAIRMAVEYPYPQTAHAFRKQVEAIAAFDGTGALSGIRKKTLVVAAAHDLLFPIEACADLARALPNATLATIDNAAHALHVENPGAFADAVIEFASS